jgi:hypothetical protein
LIALIRITLIATLRITLLAAADFLHRASSGHLAQNRLNLSERACVMNRVVDLKRIGFSIDVLEPIARVWVIAQPLRASAPSLPFQSAKHIREIVRIVSGVGHNV